MQEAIALTQVTKIFRPGLWRKKTAVKNISFTVQEGDVVGLLGANGSGKSTTMKMILGFLKPTEGEILVCGHSSLEASARKFIGYLPENPRFQRFLTARQVLHYYGRLLGLSGKALRQKAQALLVRVNLAQAADDRVQGFSKGMVQRLAIAQSLLVDPKVLIFDEPMSGLDPVGRVEIRKLIRKIHEELPQTTLFFSSHILYDVEELCSSVLLLKKGEIQRFCSVNELLKADRQRFQITLREELVNSAILSDVRHSTQRTSLGFQIAVEGSDTLISLLSRLRASNTEIIAITSERRSLEDALFSDLQKPISTPQESLSA